MRSTGGSEGSGYLLVGIGGANKGKSWPISDVPLVLGRAAECDIAVNDPVVSRRHCRIGWVDEQVRLEDLGSRNPALVNMVPTRSGALVPGDEVVLGKEAFLLAKAFGVPGRGGEPEASSDTISLGAGELFRLEQGLEELGKQEPIRTIEDLAQLYRAGQEFNACASIAELTDAVGRWVTERFDPTGFWMARVRGRDDLTFHPMAAGVGDAPAEAVREAVTEKRGFLTQEDGGHGGPGTQDSTLIVPVVFRDAVIAVLALRNESPKRAFREPDLRLLALLAQGLAPALQAAEYVQELARDNVRLRNRVGESLEIVGTSRAIRRVRGQIAKAARTDLNVLITGETGTGKELAARLLHARSARGAGPFVVVNCAAIPRDLVEGQLFGHEKGAFTGADSAAEGLVAQAHGGVLFLDEIGDLSAPAQASVLRVIETGTFRRIGAREESVVDIRVIAATNAEIDDAIASGRFRRDLYHRLSAFLITLPPLRERPSDVPVLAEHFLGMFRGQAKRPLRGFSPEALDYLRSRSWPGNVRELRNTMARAVAVARQDVIGLEDLVQDGSAGTAAIQEVLSLREAEKRHIATVLRECRGDVGAAAKVLEIGLSTLYKKLARYGIRR